MNLEGKTALVTGAGRGIGKACALELARRGARLIVNDRPDNPDLTVTVEEISALGREATPLEADVFERASCERLVAEAVAAVGRLDILVSNPAKNNRQPFLDFDPEVFEQVIHATLTAGFHLSQIAARHMVERGGGGKIIFISSVHAHVPYTGATAYNAAKSGLNHMARTIARELTPHRINVNCIEPGWIDTPTERETFGEDAIRDAGPQLPWGRIGAPADIANAAAFLASDDADYITGTVLRVDGGYVDKDA